MEWLIIGVILAIALGSWFWVAARPDPFRNAAASLGLTHSRTVPDMLPRLVGELGGLPVRVDVPENAPDQVRYQVFYRDLGVALRLERETTVTRTLGSLGGGDREIGDKAFDIAFRVNTSRPDAFKKMMTAELRQRLIALVSKHPAVVIADGEITLVTKPAEVNEADLVSTINALVAVSVLLDANRPPPLEKPASQPRPVRDATSAPPQAPATPAQPSTEPRQDSTEQVPTTPEPTYAPPPPPSPPPPPPEPDPPTTGLPDNFFEDVFGENRLSFESDDTFEQKIRGTLVTLSGTVKQANPYEGQDDVSPPQGTKAVVTVARIETDLYGASDIDAVVYLGIDAALDRGDEIEFTGKLEGIDAFMRNLFVHDGKLTATR